MGKGINEATVYSRNVGLDMKIAYGTTGNADGKQEYIGVAYPGAKTADASWQIYKLIYDANGRITGRRYAGKRDEFNQIFDNRSSLTYGSDS